MPTPRLSTAMSTQCGEDARPPTRSALLLAWLVRPPHWATARPRGNSPEGRGQPVRRGSGTLSPLRESAPPVDSGEIRGRASAVPKWRWIAGIPDPAVHSAIHLCARAPVSTARSRPRGPTSARAFEEAMGETHIPTEQPETEEEARVPAPDAQPSRPCGDPTSPHQGPLEALGLIWRVRGQSSFRALARGRRRRAGNLEVRAAVLGSSGEPPRVAFSVGRSVGGAVTRNRVRRRLRAAVREHRRGSCPGHRRTSSAPTPGAADSAVRGAFEHAARAILTDFSDGGR